MGRKSALLYDLMMFVVLSSCGAMQLDGPHLHAFLHRIVRNHNIKSKSIIIFNLRLKPRFFLLMQT